GFVPDCIVAIRRVAGGAAIHCHVPGDGRNPRHACLPARAGAGHLGLAHLAHASDLSPDAQLLHLESDPARDQRRLGKLGQTRAHRQCAGAAVTALYVFLVAPRFLDPDNMVAPLLFVGLPLFFVHALLLAMVCGSLVCASRALYTDRSWRTPAGYSVFAISLAATAVLAY